MGFVFFNIPKAKKFRYRPLTYKEGISEKNAVGKGLKGDADRTEFERELNEKWRRKNSLKRKSKGLTTLLFLILLIFVLLWIIFL